MGGIIPVKTIEEIENYIKEQEQNGALLVTGKWGSGKTYLMRQIERKLNQGPQYLMAVVSLFGIEDTNTLTKKVKEAVVYAQTFNKAEKSGKTAFRKGSGFWRIVRLWKNQKNSKKCEYVAVH